MDLDSAIFVVLDVETTGLSARSGHRICEIGAIQLKGDRESDRFQTLVNPEREVDPGAFQQHRIGAEELSGAPKFAEIAKDLRRFLAGAVFVAQNAPFDRGFLDAEFERCGMSKLACPVIDTIPLARRVQPGLRSYNLDNLALAFRLTIKDRHRAMGDCEATAEVFRQCLKSLRQRGEVRKVEDLLRRGGAR